MSTRPAQTVRARQRPIVVITSNNEKELPDAFLRRCFFHFISFPDRETMMRIVDVHYPNIKRELVRDALDIFFDVRSVPGLKKKPSTSELIDWLKLLMADDIPDGGAEEPRYDEGHSAALRRAGQERAGRAPARAPGVHAPAREPALGRHAVKAGLFAMLLNFFHGLRNGGVPVSIREYLDLLGALRQRLVFADIDAFYYLSRAVLVKDEKYFDKFDRAFAAYFKDIEDVR
jgi:hypothetical protein